MLNSVNREVRDKLKKLLETNVVTVEFWKKDGTLREMVCTLDPTYLPIQDTYPSRYRRHNEEILAVWDLEKSDWRSFRIDSVRSYIARRAEASWTQGKTNGSVRDHLLNRLEQSWLPPTFKVIFASWLKEELRNW